MLALPIPLEAATNMSQARGTLAGQHLMLLLQLLRLVFACQLLSGLLA